jgi:hypothetical protein
VVRGYNGTMRLSRSVCIASLLLVVAACGRSVDLTDDGVGGDGSVGTQTGSKSTGSKPTSTGSSTTSAQGGASPAVTTGSSSELTTSTGISDGGSSSTGMICGGFGTACTECESASCADVWCGCVNNPECLGAYACWNDCMPGDMDCAQQCYVDHEAGLSAALLVSDCAATTCQDDCGWGQDVPPCTECLYKNCADATNACIVDAECIPLSQCLNGCAPSSIQCQQQCYADHGPGVDPLQAVIDCSAMECQAVCG